MEMQDFYKKSGPKSNSAADIAESFLKQYVSGGHTTLRYYRGQFFEYQSTHYVKKPTDELRAIIMGFINSNLSTRNKANISFVNNVLANLEADTLVPSNTRTPCFLSAPGVSTSRLIGMKNGIFDLSLYMGGKPPLIAHTADFFSFNCLPFKYDDSIVCPVWSSFVEEVHPDSETRDFLQEWIGYGLVPDTTHHYFVVFIGDGANGKSVFCCVMRELYGRDNVSAVGLEQFNPTRTFPLHAMVGKLVNIVEEIGEVDKVAEGILKNIVSGGEMTIEQKNKDPILAKSTARLTFATNVLPRFRDRSNGLWRRMVPIQFLVQILDTKKQNKNLVDGDWWISSAELPGIMNWALQGLARLMTRGHFILPESSNRLLAEYKDEANPAKLFLEENCTFTSGANVSQRVLYLKYSKWIRDQGGVPLGGTQFRKEVEKHFPKVTLSPNPKHFGRERSRAWQNLSFISDSEQV